MMWAQALNLDLKHLRCALLAAEHRSFAKAAELMGMKQSTLSRHITVLEQSLGTRLFVRSTRGAAPTEAGLIMLEKAHRVFEELEELHASTAAVGHGLAGTLRLGFNTSVSAGNLRASLLAFEAAFPEIRVVCVEEGRARLLARLDNSTVDLLIISGTATYSDILRMSLWNEAMFVVLRDDHVLASRDKVYWPDLDGAPFLVPRSADDMAAMVHARLARAGSSPQINLVDLSRETVLSMVYAREAVALVCAAATGMRFDNLVLRELHDNYGPQILPYSAYWRPSNGNPALRTFLNWLCDRYSLTLPATDAG